MPTPVAPQILYVDRLETTIGTLLLIHDREGHVRALDFHDFESRMRRLLRLHYGAEGDDFAIEVRRSRIFGQRDKLKANRSKGA